MIFPNKKELRLITTSISMNPGKIIRLNSASGLTFCRSRTFGLGSIVERRERRAHGDAVKNSVAFNDR